MWIVTVLVTLNMKISILINILVAPNMKILIFIDTDYRNIKIYHKISIRIHGHVLETMRQK